MHFIKPMPHSKNPESGATLLFAIVLITIVALLGVGLFSLITTSQLNQAEAQKSASAYYISESCLRIAASEYKHAREISTTEATSALVNIHGSTLPMPDSQGSCSVTIYPYWFYAPAASTTAKGSKTLTLYLPGAVPPAEENGSTSISLNFPANVIAKLRMKSKEYEFTGATFAGSFTSGTGTLTTFSLNVPLADDLTISGGDEFYLGATYSMPATPTTITAGGSLVLNINSLDTGDLTAYIFPPVKGSIFLDATGIRQLSYDTRVITKTTSPHTVTLTNIQAIGSTTLPLTISASPTIYMGKSLGIKSEAAYGN